MNKLPQLWIALTLLLTGCPKAGRVEGKVFDAHDATFGVPVAAKPDDGRWVMTRNYSWGSRRVVDWERHAPSGLRKSLDVDIRMTISPISDDDRKVPLDFLAQGLMESYGRERGIHTRVLTIQRADFGAHEGVIVYALRTANLVKRKVAQIFVRAGRDLVMVSYIADPELYDRYAPEFTAAAERFAVGFSPDKARIGIPLPSDLPEEKREQLKVLATPVPVATP